MSVGFGVGVGVGVEVGVSVGTAVGTSVGVTAVAVGVTAPSVGVAVAAGAGVAHPANSAPSMMIAAVIFLIWDLVRVDGFDDTSV